jgi:hypothetical protein
MITNSQLRVIESSLDKLKPTLYGMKVKYDCSVIEENLRFNLGFNELGVGSYKPMLRIKMTLDGSPNIYVVTPGILEAEVEGFLSKVFTYVLPSDHLLVSRPWATVFEFYYGVQKILYSEIFKSPKYTEYSKNFVNENKEGTIEITSTFGYSINYTDLTLSEWSERDDLGFIFECTTKSFNYIDDAGQEILITDDMWSDFYLETSEPTDMVKESLIIYFNTQSSDWDSNIINEFAREINLHEKLSPYVRDNFGWKYESFCSSLSNPNEFPWDSSQGNSDRKNMFLQFFNSYFKKS